MGDNLNWTRDCQVLNHLRRSHWGSSMESKEETQLCVVKVWWIVLKGNHLVAHRLFPWNSSRKCSVLDKWLFEVFCAPYWWYWLFNSPHQHHGLALSQWLMDVWVLVMAQTWHSGHSHSTLSAHKMGNLQPWDRGDLWEQDQQGPKCSADSAVSQPRVNWNTATRLPACSTLLKQYSALDQNISWDFDRFVELFFGCLACVQCFFTAFPLDNRQQHEKQSRPPAKEWWTVGVKYQSSERCSFSEGSSCWCFGTGDARGAVSTVHNGTVH